MGFGRHFPSRHHRRLSRLGLESRIFAQPYAFELTASSEPFLKSGNKTPYRCRCQDGVKERMSRVGHTLGARFESCPFLSTAVVSFHTSNADTFSITRPLDNPLHFQNLPPSPPEASRQVPQPPEITRVAQLLRPLRHPFPALLPTTFYRILKRAFSQKISYFVQKHATESASPRDCKRTCAHTHTPAGTVASRSRVSVHCYLARCRSSPVSRYSSVCQTLLPVPPNAAPGHRALVFSSSPCGRSSLGQARDGIGGREGKKAKGCRARGFGR